MASSPPPHHQPSHLFTSIQEVNEKEETIEKPRHHHRHKSRRQEKLSGAGERVVSCLDCRPNPNKEKTCCVVIVPVDNNNPMHGTKHALTSSPSNPSTGLFKSLLAGISRRSPKSPAAAAVKSDEQWRELSKKLILATRKRDEAILEASRMKHSVAELEGKLTRLETYCNNLKLESCGGRRVSASFDSELIVKYFLAWVSEARSSVRLLSKSLTSQIRLMGSKVFEKLSNTLRSYDVKIMSLLSGNPRNMQMYVEALLNSILYDDFESVGFERNSMTRILNPIERSESSYQEFNGLKDLCWDEVLSKGTKHFSQEFSRFCDRKMSEIVAMLGWNRAWPEKLLQAFFGASKSVWLVHLLANSVHPALTIFRVDKGVRFDPVYMEDMSGEKMKKLVPIMVRIMVEPGFYVYHNVVKCKVICRYYNNSNYGVLSISNNNDDSSGIST